MEENWLIDTFAIIGYDVQALPRSWLSSLMLDGRLRERPKVLYRYPVLPAPGEVDESSGQVDHVTNIIDFCHPLGWTALRRPKLPQFHLIVLTDTPGCRLYAAVFNLFEAVLVPRDSSDDVAYGDDEEAIGETASVASWRSNTGTQAASNTPVKPSPRLLGTNLAGDLHARRNSKSSLRSVSSANQERAVSVPPPENQYIYLPKSLVILSKYNYSDVFRSCLNVIYRVHLEQISRFSIEDAIANLVASVLVPPPGHPPVSFSLGVGPRLTIRQPLCKTVPVTGTSVYQLFHYLGVHNTLLTVCCLLNEFKVVVHSSSLNHLTQCCHALVSLLFPLPYYHVYIPVLPESIIAMLSAPTPFLIGIHSLLRQEALQQPDVVVVDLDTGSVRLPESIRLLQLNEVCNARVTNDLMRVLNPELFVADNAFTVTGNSMSLWSSANPSGSIADTAPSALLSSATACLTDKMLRACFLRLFASLFAGYRHSLSAIRICPEPRIVFDKAHFLGQRGEAFTPTECLLCSLLTSFFPQFLQERMLPYREVDIFDELCSTISATMAEEEANPDRAIENIRLVAHQLLQNEQIPSSGITPGLNSSGNDSDNLSTVLANVKQPYPALPVPDGAQIERLINDARSKILAASSTAPKQPDSISSSKKRKVIMGSPVTIDSSMPHSFQRRLEVVRTCVGHVFGNKIAEARRLLPATMRALKLVEVRRRLPAELSRFAFSEPNEDQQQTIIAPVLNNHQFDLVVQIVVFALSLESHWDENGIAAAMLPLSTIFYRFLGDSRHQQFLYTAIQEHPLWLNQAFWTSVIYRHIAAAVAAVHNTTKSTNNAPNVAMEPPLSLEVCGRMLDQQSHETASNGLALPDHPHSGHQNGSSVTNGINGGSLLLNGEKMTKIENLSREEESMAYSYCKHFANLMVYLLTPLDPSRDLSGLLNSGSGHGEFAANSSQSQTDNAGGAADSSIYSESGFDEQDLRDVKGVVHWFISRVLQNVCTETGVTDDHRRNLESILGETVGSHMDYLEMVYQHTRHLPPLQKPRILEPTLLPGEQKLIGPLRAIILPDGRRLGINGDTWIGQAPTSSKNNALNNVAGGGRGRRLAQSGAVSDVTSVATGGAAGDLDDTGSSDHAVCLLPAEGAVFLTTYRLVFIGNPTDAFASEVVICRSIPVASLWSEKQVAAVYLHHPYDHYFTQCYQMRSNTLEIMKILFDSTEVSESAIVDLRQQLASLRWPVDVTSLFCARQLFSTSITSVSATVSGTEVTPTLNQIDGRKTTVSKSKLKTLAKNTLSKLNVGANVQLSIERKIARTGQLIQRQFHVTSSSSSTIRASQRGSSLVPHQHTGTPLGATNVNFTNTDRVNLLMADFDRLKLGAATGRPEVGPSANNNNSGWRLTFVNRQFLICRSYPEVLSTLLAISDETLKRLAQGCRMTRFPSAVWRHSSTGAVLVRSAAFMSPTNRVITAIRRTTNESAPTGSAHKDEGATITTSSSTFAADLTTYFTSLAQLTLISSNNGEGTLRGVSQQTVQVEPVRPESKSSSVAEPTSTPANSRRGHSGSISATPSNVGVCIIGDAAQLKSLRSVITDPSVDFISIKVTAPADIKAAYKRLIQKTMCPADAGERKKREMFNSNATSSTSSFHPNGASSSYPSAIEGSASLLSGEGFYKALNDSGWLQQISTLLRVASMVAMLIDAASISVVVAAEDGSDFVTQVVCLAQLLLDPYYRTRAGFKVLIVREWLAFGHRFGVRGSQMAANRLTSFIPVFLQFLDAVHQLVDQFPIAFEFNQFFIKSLAYHSTSNRFFDWLLDCDADRLACGLPLLGNNLSDDKSDSTFFWDFADKQWETSPVYFNFLYDAERSSSLVLSPKYVLPYLRVWDYFYGHPLATDLTYDAFSPLSTNPPRQLSDSSSAIVKHETVAPVLVDAAFEAPETVFCSGFIAALKAYCDILEAGGLSSEDGQSIHELPWYDALKNGIAHKEKPQTDTLMSPVFHPRIPVPSSRQLFNWTLSQMTSAKLLDMARSLGSMSLSEMAISFSRGSGNQPHVLRQVSSVSKASICAACSAMLWPPTPAVVCDRCPLVAHRQCQGRVSKMHQCPGSTASNNSNESPATASHPASPPQVIMYRSDLIAPTTQHTPMGRVAAGRNPDTLQSSKMSSNSSTLPSSMPSRYMMCGSLYKRGQLLNGLTRRFYVLDLASQRIVYYESHSEAEISGGVGAEKGAIPLTQITEVVPLDPQQSIVDSSQPVEYGFTIVTNKRSHHFLTSTQKEADKWSEAIAKALTLL